MPRGGKREKAGRKTGWGSGVKFEETTPIRIPKYLKDKLLEIAHRLDSGEDFDSVSNSNEQELQKLRSNLSLIELHNQKLVKQLEQAEKHCLDLETESKLLNSRLDELEYANKNLVRELENSKLDLDTKSKEYENKVFYSEQKNKTLQDEIDKYCIVSSNGSNHFFELISQFAQKWRIQVTGLSPINMAAKTHQMLSELQKLILEEKQSIDLINSSQIDLNNTLIEVNTEKPKQERIVTKSKGHTQLGLLDIDNNKNSSNLKPLSSKDLSKRFGKSDNFVKAKKYQLKDRIQDFELLLKESDPDGVGWKYSEEDKKYHPVTQD